jgi:hypothetical protein
VAWIDLLSGLLTVCFGGCRLMSWMLFLGLEGNVYYSYCVECDGSSLGL